MAALGSNLLSWRETPYTQRFSPASKQSPHGNYSKTLFSKRVQVFGSVALLGVDTHSFLGSNLLA